MDCNLRVGDLLYRTKDLVEHAGVYLEKDSVFHISPSNGAEAVSFEQYADGKQVKVVHTEIENKQLLEERLSEVLSHSSAYNVVSNNCEHLASFLINGRKSSPQLQATVLGMLVGVILGRKMSSYGLLVMAAIGGLSGCLLSNALRQYDSYVEGHSKFVEGNV